MTQPTPAATRGRRDPQLLAQQQAEAAQQLAEESLDQELDERGQLLYDGESVTFSASLPVTLEGADRYSLIGGEAHCVVQPDEDPEVTGSRARLAVRIQIMEGVDELEQDLDRLAEERAARRARLESLT